MHKTFISYHHANEQDIKDDIIKRFGGADFIDKSVGDGDIDPTLSEDRIMTLIRTEFLYDSTVTLVLIGSETSRRPYVNSEIQASLRDTDNNKHNGLLAVIRDELYDSIYSTSTCSCGHSIRVKDSGSYERYVPDLIRKNHEYGGQQCHFGGGDVYCAIIKYSTFRSEPERYIEQAYDKRDDKRFIIRKTCSAGVPRIGGI